MARAINPTNPSSVNTQNMVQASGATGTYFNVVSVRIPIPASAGTRIAWINPETGTVAVTNVGYMFPTTGTGTVDIGVADDGTAAGSSIIDGGTMLANFYSRGDASATAGIAQGAYTLVGPGGTGTSNSITMTLAEGATSTAVGFMVLTYFPIGS